MVSRIDAIGSGRRKKFLRAYRERESLCAFGALVAWLYRRADMGNNSTYHTNLVQIEKA